MQGCFQGDGGPVNENLVGAGRGRELGGSIQTMYSQPMEALDKAMEESSTLRAVPCPQDQVCLRSLPAGLVWGFRLMDFRAESLLMMFPMAGGVQDTISWLPQMAS